MNETWPRPATKEEETHHIIFFLTRMELWQWLSTRIVFALGGTMVRPYGGHRRAPVMVAMFLMPCNHERGAMELGKRLSWHGSRPVVVRRWCSREASDASRILAKDRDARRQMLGAEMRVGACGVSHRILHNVAGRLVIDLGGHLSALAWQRWHPLSSMRRSPRLSTLI